MSKTKKYDFKQLADELHSPYHKSKNTRHVNVHGVNSIFTADLADLNDVKQFNDNYRYILFVMDVYSRYVWYVKMKKKDKKTSEEAFKEIFKKAGKPEYLWIDQGKEFFNKPVLKFLKKQGVKTYSTFGNHKAMIIERFNRTMKTWMYKAFTENNSKNWTGIIDKLVDKYNNKFHKGIQAIPDDVYNDDYKVYHKYRDPVIKPAKFKVGDKVRLYKKKGVFEKSYTPNWTIELFTIDKILPTNPVTYKLKDENGEEILGSVYDNEILKTKLTEPIHLIDEVLQTKTEKGKKKHLVSWLGYRKNMNSWIDDKDLYNV